MGFFFKSKPATDADIALSNEAQTELDILIPVLNKIKENKALHIISKGVDWITEYILYILAIAAFVFVFIMDKITPFHLITEIQSKKEIKEAISNSGDIQLFVLGIRFLVLTIGVLLFILGTMYKRKRVLKNTIQEAVAVLTRNKQFFESKLISSKETEKTTIQDNLSDQNDTLQQPK